jgi:hypothetical protein
MASVPNLNAVDHNDEEDMYLSDIHIEQHSDNEKSSIRVEIRMPPAILEDRGKNLMIDSDGDFVRSSSNMYVIRIEHDMATTLSRVGLQLWRASFFLSDYVLNNLELVRDKTVIELGTGLGLVSFVTSAYARLVFATDLGFVVQRARQNWIANQKRIDWTSGGEIRFKKLVWDNYESIFDPPSKSSGKVKLVTIL